MADRNILNLAGPPRFVPLQIKVINLFSPAGIFWWLFLGIGMLLVWGFTLNADLTGWYHFRGQLETADGTILSREILSYVESEQQGQEDIPVCSYRYCFVGPDGVEYTGRSIKKGLELKKGEKVTVEYPKAHPQISRIRGMSRSTVGLFALMPVIFPLIGLIAVVRVFKKGIKANRLLRNGLQTTGKLISKKHTGVWVGSRRHGDAKPIYKLTFEFTAENRQNYKAVTKTEKPEKLEDEAAEPLLYDPIDPSHAVMLDALPGWPRIDDNGNIRVGSPVWTTVGAIILLIFPAAVIIGHGTYIYLRFFAN